MAGRQDHRLHGQAARDRERQHAGALISLSPNYPDFAYKLQLQNWREWVRRGIVDELLVQLYRPDLESFSAELERPVPIALVSAQAEATRAGGLGMALFYFETLW
ncbi:MAG: family 10 glycosylhydrolase [Cyanobium sp.]